MIRARRLTVAVALVALVIAGAAHAQPVSVLSVVRTGPTWATQVRTSGVVPWLQLAVYGAGWPPPMDVRMQPSPGLHTLLVTLPAGQACPCLLDLTHGTWHPGAWCVALEPGQTPHPWWAGPRWPLCPVWHMPPHDGPPPFIFGDGFESGNAGAWAP